MLKHCSHFKSNCFSTHLNIYIPEFGQSWQNSGQSKSSQRAFYAAQLWYVSMLKHCSHFKSNCFSTHLNIYPRIWPVLAEFWAVKKQSKSILRSTALICFYAETVKKQCSHFKSNCFSTHLNIYPRIWPVLAEFWAVKKQSKSILRSTALICFYAETL